MWWIKSTDSIKRRLHTWFTLVFIILWLLVAIGNFVIVRHEVNELFDGELSQLARVLMTLYISDKPGGQIKSNQPLITSPPFQGDENYEKKLLFQIWDENNNLLMKSSNAPLTRLTDKINQFEDVDFLANVLRIYSLNVPSQPYTVHVAQAIEIRNEIAYESIETFLFFMLISFLLALWIITRVINRGLKPLLEVSQQVSRRSLDNLEQVSLDNIPTEINAIIVSLNHLFKRLKSSFSRERQFISDAAHELRTPLAGLKAQAQIASIDKSRVDQSMSQIIQGVDRTSRLASQLLALSRLDHDFEISREQIVLAPLVEMIVSDLESVAQRRDVLIKISIAPDISVESDHALLYMLLRNLIENAIRYTLVHTNVIIDMRTTESEMSMTISDQGPGIEEAKMDRVFDRFYREAGQKEQGSGLGLSIVKEVAHLLNVAIELNNREAGGLSVRLIFLV